ncbi:MAG: hypothetical protein V2I43_16365 [Parvularcula sp.]|jgi:hypothetical protein|nr:hypothetical protein [Parvularcula sp.]
MMKFTIDPDLISFELTAATGKLDLYRVLYAGTEVYTNEIDTAFIDRAFIRADAQAEIQRRVDAMSSHQRLNFLGETLQMVP